MTIRSTTFIQGDSITFIQGEKRDDKIEALRALERLDIVREMCPREDGWHFYVAQPMYLPVEFHEEYLRYGEIRW